ncbi:serine/threonine-protein kinase [Streptomyces triticirhizae]|uniref:non-specific serine/threonine protein kinase n=1 Tax=Streptomyces triticirhizae TaxID=2483353 RepID=A0A3M2LNE7_9ACTN|nr:serine/threonine-protein kinase [Streptomyces triticirhizae]RMI38967.1 serine/threonine protein kinase [Streptomyces triticirhizae]
MREGMAVGDRYRVERLLGRGGLGEVWEAEDRTLGRRVAVKFVTGGREYPEAARRFAREARTLAALRHGGIVTVHDAGTADGETEGEEPLPYLVMELLDGATWEFAAVESVEETGARVAEVLAHVHAARIVHRDVKPANIMICADGRTVLMDFGIARDDDSLTRTATATGRYFGTPAYMAPEQLQGRAATAASDVYALGIVLVEKLTGHRLPVGQLMPQVRSALPEPLRSLLERMTSAHPEQRPTAAECAAQLRALAAPKGTRRPRGPLTRTARVTVPAPGDTGRRVWLRRLVPPAVLAVLYALVLPRPGYKVWTNWNETVFASFAKPPYYAWVRDVGEPTLTWGAITSVGVVLGVVAVLTAMAFLDSRLGARARGVGYAGAALAVLCLAWQATSSPPYFDGEPGPLRYGMWLFYLLTAVTLATFAQRDLAARRAGADAP